MVVLERRTSYKKYIPYHLIQQSTALYACPWLVIIGDLLVINSTNGSGLLQTTHTLPCWVLVCMSFMCSSNRIVFLAISAAVVIGVNSQCFYLAPLWFCLTYFLNIFEDAIVMTVSCSSSLCPIRTLSHVICHDRNCPVGLLGPCGLGAQC